MLPCSTAVTAASTFMATSGHIIRVNAIGPIWIVSTETLTLACPVLHPVST